MFKPIALITLALAAALLTGCSPYDYDYAFEPRPVDVVLKSQGEDGVVRARALVAVIGVLKADRDAGWPRSVEVRLRIENESDQPITFPPGRLQLFSGDLIPFGEPRTDPAGPVTIEPHGVIDAAALFPFPPDMRERDMNLRGLNLRITVLAGGEPITRSVTFRRVVPDYYYGRRSYYGRPFFYHPYHYHPHFGFSYGYWYHW